MVAESLADSHRISPFFPYLRCPCGSEWSAAGTEFDCDACGRSYRFDEGILRNRACEAASLSSSDLRDVEQATRDRQAGLYDWWMRINVPSWKEWRVLRRLIQRVSPGVALELGCGTGRLSLELARHGHRVIAVDRSWKSLQVAQSKLAAHGVADSALLVQADLSEAPVKPRAFDLGVSAQVLEHLPSDELRVRAVALFAESLRPGGALAVSVYEWRQGALVHGAKEGAHAGGIYYYRFSRDEISRLLEPHFLLRALTSCGGQILVADCERRSKDATFDGQDPGSH